MSLDSLSVGSVTSILLWTFAFFVWMMCCDVIKACDNDVEQWFYVLGILLLSAFTLFVVVCWCIVIVLQTFYGTKFIV